MNASLKNLITVTVLALSLFVFSSAAFAQGTATGPVTFHDVVFDGSGPFVPIGPQPIDLDPNGPPWTKFIFDDAGFLTNDPFLNITERIINVGDEPWFDWHEDIIPGPTGVIAIWNDVKLFVNGNPIGFNATGLGSPGLNLDGFSQPVLPGDTFTIEKTALFLGPVPATGAPVLIIEEYPTPEPASAALIGVGLMGLLRRRYASR